MWLQELRLSERSKAENLFLEADGADFGSSNEFPQGSKLGTFCGTAPYAARNSSRAKSYHSPAVHAYGLGAILYRPVSGSLPFDGQTTRRCRSRY